METGFDDFCQNGRRHFPYIVLETLLVGKSGLPLLSNLIPTRLHHLVGVAAAWFQFDQFIASCH